MRATGSYRPDLDVVVRYQTRDGASGVDVVTPLQVDGGALLLVNRGWLATENAGDASPDVPAPPDGEVTVEGWVRADLPRNGRADGRAYGPRNEVLARPARRAKK